MYDELKGGQMALGKNDLKEIGKIVDSAEQRIIKYTDKKITQTGERILEITEERDRKMKNEIISVIAREVKDLAEINQAVIEKVSKIPDHEKRITRIETKLDLSRV